MPGVRTYRDRLGGLTSGLVTAGVISPPPTPTEARQEMLDRVRELTEWLGYPPTRILALRQPVTPARAKSAGLGVGSRGSGFRRDATRRGILFGTPWVETHGYHRGIATR